MFHETPLITTIVVGLGLAFVFGAIAQRLRVSPLVGYLLAGVAVGPFTPGFVADAVIGAELAEIGVILLMFGVGLHFSLNDLLSVRAIAPGALIQIGAATLFGLGLALSMGWTVGAGLVFGLAVSVASTVVLMRAIQERRLMETERGRIAVGWLIVEDLAMVLALVLMPALAQVLDGSSNDSFASEPLVTRFGLGLAGVLVFTFVKVGCFVGLMLVVGAAAVLSIFFNPLMFAIADRLGERIEKQLRPIAPPTAPPSPSDATALTDHTILVGYVLLLSFGRPILKQSPAMPRARTC